MAKKISKPSKRNPSVAQMDQFVMRGRGHDTVKQVASDVPMSRLTISLPEELHTEFKIACTRARRKMNKEIQEFIRKRTKELNE